MLLGQRILEKHLSILVLEDFPVLIKDRRGRGPISTLYYLEHDFSALNFSIGEVTIYFNVMITNPFTGIFITSIHMLQFPPVNKE